MNFHLTFNLEKSSITITVISFEYMDSVNSQWPLDSCNQRIHWKLLPMDFHNFNYSHTMTNYWLYMDCMLMIH